MSTYTSSEDGMWEKPIRLPQPRKTDEEINLKYSDREWRIVTEMNREQIQNFVEALKRPGWMEVRPFYQRRQRWDEGRQSRLIESFIMNVPVPPLFVYETDLAKYEVMDGQQRITAIQEFYSGNLTLTGLEHWPELNGRTYSKLPSEIKRGIDRRSISYIVLLHESARGEEEASFLKQLVFERLNTGGVALSRQEIRNCIYQGSFNRLILKLAEQDLFRQTLGLPKFTESERANPSEELRNSTIYLEMKDIEMVLRFFALRHSDHYQRGMQGFLDLYMGRAKHFSDEELQRLKSMFESTLSLGNSIYGDKLYRPWNPKKQDWEKSPHIAFGDAVMVGLSSHLDKANELIRKRDHIIARTKSLFDEFWETGRLTGRGNSKSDVQDRITLFSTMLEDVLKQ